MERYSCKTCKDSGFTNKSNSWAYNSSTMSWHGICPDCRFGWYKVDVDDRYTDVKEFGGVREEI